MAKKIEQVRQAVGAGAVIIGMGGIGTANNDPWGFTFDGDVTIVDFVADLRAPTPSAAAELISSNYLDCAGRVERAREAREAATVAALDRAGRRLAEVGDDVAGDLERVGVVVG